MAKKKIFLEPNCLKSMQKVIARCLLQHTTKWANLVEGILRNFVFLLRQNRQISQKMLKKRVYDEYIEPRSLKPM